MSDESTRVSFFKTPYLAQFALGRTTSVVGAQIVTVTAGYELYQRTHDPWMVGLTGLFELLPVLFLMIPAGTAADTYPRRNVGVFAQILLAFASLGLALVSYKHWPIASMYGLLVIVGAARAFASPSLGSIMPQLVTKAQLPATVAWLSSSYELASIGGPALSGFLIAVSPSFAYGAAAVGQVIFIAMLFTLPAMPPKHDVQRKAEDVLVGFRFIKSNPLFLSAITLDLFAVLFGGAVSLLPVFAADILAVGPRGLGWLRAAPAFGALTMALVLTRTRPWARPGRVLYVAVIGFALATIAFGVSRSFVLSMVCLYATGLFDEVSVVIRSTLQQTITPDYLRGRVSAVNYVFIGFSNEFGAFESGTAA
ncbi:MAG: MFS transporter, partial [Clostridia bacterium]|nr:MFS transporter [Deltaproteobacteria bacterium]